MFSKSKNIASSNTDVPSKIGTIVGTGAVF